MSEPPPTPRWQTLDAFLEETNHDLPIQDSERYVSFSMDDLRPDWWEEARCKGVGFDYYFGASDQKSMSFKQVRNAAKLCEVCPAFAECLTWALTNREEYGVWAGTSGRVRRKIFSLIDNDLAQVEDVVERFINGQGDFYRDFPPDGIWGDRAYEAGDGLRDEVAG